MKEVKYTGAHGAITLISEGASPVEIERNKAVKLSDHIISDLLSSQPGQWEVVEDDVKDRKINKKEKEVNK